MFDKRGATMLMSAHPLLLDRKYQALATNLFVLDISDPSPFGISLKVIKNGNHKYLRHSRFIINTY